LSGVCWQKCPNAEFPFKSWRSVEGETIMFSNPKIGSFALVVFLILSAPVIVLAHKEATGAVKERMEAMKDVAANMKILGAMMKGEIAFNSAEAEKAAKTIANHAAKVTELFPKGSSEKPSEALPAIWTDWTDFTRYAEELRRRAEDLNETIARATASIDFKDSFIAMGKTCKGCHEKFRLKK
jgi:cytochrome c556